LPTQVFGKGWTTQTTMMTTTQMTT
jgi:hypothetical protein